MTPARVRAIRKSANLSTRQLQRILGLSAVRTVHRWEDGECPVSGPAVLVLELIERGELPQWALDRKDAQ